MALTGEMPATEFLPKAKAAAIKAIELDDQLAEAHSALGFIIFWYDWDWNAAEKQYQRVLELDPDSATRIRLTRSYTLSRGGRRKDSPQSNAPANSTRLT